MKILLHMIAVTSMCSLLWITPDLISLWHWLNNSVNISSALSSFVQCFAWAGLAMSALLLSKQAVHDGQIDNPGELGILHCLLHKYRHDPVGLAGRIAPAFGMAGTTGYMTGSKHIIVNSLSHGLEGITDLLGYLLGAVETTMVGVCIFIVAELKLATTK